MVPLICLVVILCKIGQMLLLNALCNAPHPPPTSATLQNRRLPLAQGYHAGRFSTNFSCGFGEQT